MSTNKVLIPLADAEFSLHVLPHVTRLLDPDHNELILLHVAPVTSAVTLDERVLVYADQEAASAEAESRASLQPYVRSLGALGYHVTPVVTFGDPASEIEHFVEQEGVDLVAMTTHGRTGLVRALMGSVAEHVVGHVEIPVMLYRSASDYDDGSPLGK
jgi:nucleotide-binding universal stress UspA family protein